MSYISCPCGSRPDSVPASERSNLRVRQLRPLLDTETSSYRNETKRKKLEERKKETKRKKQLALKTTQTRLSSVCWYKGCPG
ncbi:hypothetical protein SRHO_G00009150 [Serrasalmus rhombeus]